jgi:hypothetical protein
MDAFLYPVITVLYLILLFWSFRSFRESSFWGTSWTLFLIVALIYDNGVISLGGWLGRGELLEMLSLVRYLLHVLLTPTLVFVSLDILRRIHIEWSEYLSTHVIYNLYTFTLTVLGVFTEILWIDLEPVEVGGVVRYVAAESHLPYATILAMLPLLISGQMVWRRLRWPVLLVGVALSMVTGAVGFFTNHMVIGSIGQLVLMWTLVITEQMLGHEDFQSHRTMWQ